MSKIDTLLEQMRNNPQNIKFTDLCKVCEKYFGKARQVRSIHRIYKIPWQGDPRVNIQNNKGKLKSYKFMVRVPPEVHRHLALEATEAGVSLNRIASSKLTR